MYKKHNIRFIAILIIVLAYSCSGSYRYESVPNDPLQARIYTLDNGLKVYLAVNKDKPRIQTFIGVRVGSKNDPAETTGLAHYFEHLMFKGTSKFGTTDYEAEKPMLDQIEALFEIYRSTTDSQERIAIYAKIDSISQEASKIAIPNEYDKLMSAIGSNDSDAFTSYDVTAYMEDIPSNEIENWAYIQSERFIDPVLRLFHSELETVFEEYNMGLTDDSEKVLETIMAELFPNHPYGKQTVIGTQEHLKNPSITNIKNYFDTWYVPNNMAVVMAGDLNPDKTIKVIDKYFGKMKPKELPKLTYANENQIIKPIEKEVIGLEAANVTIGFRFPGANSQEVAIMELINYMLYNGSAGLIDINLVLKQKLLRGGSRFYDLADYSLFELFGTPKAGQTLEEVKDILLSQIELIKMGAFDDNLLTSVINNFKLSRYYQQASYFYAAYIMLDAFINNQSWKSCVDRIDYQSQFTKQDLVDFCNNYLNDNYVVVYKREGQPDLKKIDKPNITPISTNRESESFFLAQIKEQKAAPIEPVFLDYNKDISKLSTKQGVELLYKHNETNPIFSLYYVFEMGNNHDKALGTAFNYLSYLGTSTKTAEEIKNELYQLACSFRVQSTNERVYVYISGLSDNFERAMELFEDRLSDAQADKNIYSNLVSDILKRRSDAKLSQHGNFSALQQYATYGPKSPLTHILSKEALTNMDPNELTIKTKNLKNFEHTILYYGPLTERQIVEVVDRMHIVGEQLQPVPTPQPFFEQETTQNRVFLAQYDAKQIYMGMVNKGGTFNKSIEPIRTMFNTYFGGGMNAIVFQEMREARGLAYSANARYSMPSKPDRPYLLTTSIATQNDKMMDAIQTFLEILNDMPESEKSFSLAKEEIITDIRTERILRSDILFNYLNARQMGYETDKRKEVYERVAQFTFDDVKAFHESYIKDRPYTYYVLGDIKDLDLKSLESLGEITKLSQLEIFGY
ncbi:MAG: insulinase family protein [Prevotellaceae bacterium]|jgi:predicted Zn-dependent peptidase|nr:insulinase family protein [Prevotellaceae bacterium]